MVSWRDGEEASDCGFTIAAKLLLERSSATAGAEATLGNHKRSSGETPTKTRAGEDL